MRTLSDEKQKCRYCTGSGTQTQRRDKENLDKWSWLVGIRYNLDLPCAYDEKPLEIYLHIAHLCW